MAKTAVFEAMMGSLYCMSIIMCFLAHLAIGHSLVDIGQVVSDQKIFK
jgi:uncharacterized membrane protein